MKMRMKRMMGFFLALVMVMGFLPLNPTVSYADAPEDVEGYVNGGVYVNSKNFPDETFREYVHDNFDSDNDYFLDRNELRLVGDISLNNSSVSNLKGIEYFTNLRELYCNGNNLTSLDVSKNKILSLLSCENNKLTSLDVSNNTDLRTLICPENKLTSLDLSENTSLIELDCKDNPLTSIKLVRKGTAPSWIYNMGLTLSPVKYTVKVEKGSKIIPFNKLPQGFDKSRIKSAVQRVEDGFTWDGSTKPIQFRYQLCEKPGEVTGAKNTIVDAEITVTEVEFDPAHVEKMVVKEQPKKLTYTEEEKLDLTGLEVTLTDNQGLKKDVAFTDADFSRRYGIKATPENGAPLTADANNEKPVKLTKEGVQDALTANLKVNKVYTITYTDGVASEVIFVDQVYKAALDSDTPAFKGETPNRKDYVFAGWNPTVAENVTDNATYVAQWKDDKNNNHIPDDQEAHFTVTYTDGVDNEVIFEDQVHKNILVNMPTPAFKGTVPKRKDYDFVGWDPVVAQKVTADVKYVAQWKRIQRTVTFKDGDKALATVKVETGKAIDTDALAGESMPKNPKKDGYTFKAWNTKEDGKGETFTGASVVNGDMTVYAIYTKDSVPMPALIPILTADPTPNPPTPELKSQPKKHIGMIPKTGESASYAGLLAALGFSLAGLAILRMKKMMEENNK